MKTCCLLSRFYQTKSVFQGPQWRETQAFSLHKLIQFLFFIRETSTVPMELICHDSCTAQQCVCRLALLYAYVDGMQICSEGILLFFALLLCVCVCVCRCSCSADRNVTNRRQRNGKVGHIYIVCYLTNLNVFQSSSLIKALYWSATVLVLRHTSHSCTLYPAGKQYARQPYFLTC